MGPKTAAAYRMVALSDRAIEIIRLFESENELYKLEYPDYDDKGIPFGTAKGTPILHSIINYYLKKVMVDMEIRKSRWKSIHTLRRIGRDISWTN